MGDHPRKGRRSIGCDFLNVLQLQRVLSLSLGPWSHLCHLGAPSSFSHRTLSVHVIFFMSRFIFSRLLYCCTLLISAPFLSPSHSSLLWGGLLPAHPPPPPPTPSQAKLNGKTSSGQMTYTVSKLLPLLFSPSLATNTARASAPTSIIPAQEYSRNELPSPGVRGVRTAMPGNAQSIPGVQGRGGREAAADEGGEERQGQTSGRHVRELGARLLKARVCGLGLPVLSHSPRRGGFCVRSRKPKDFWCVCSRQRQREVVRVPPAVVRALAFDRGG